MSTQLSLTDIPIDTPNTPVGTLEDNHELSERAREYGEEVIQGNEWPIEHVNLEKISWKTSTKAKRRHGLASYNGNDEVTITISKHTYDRAGFESCKSTIRHELVHAWQYQNSGKLAIVTQNGVEDSTIDDVPDEKWAELGSRYENPADEHAVKIKTGHGNSFQRWVPALDLDGRCSNHYSKRRDDYSYIYECPECGDWWGKHRMCKSVRQAAHGGKAAWGYRYCTSCDVKLYLRVEDIYMQYDFYTDQEIKQFTGTTGSEDDVETARNEFGVPIDLATVEPV